jgi:hypothetical protein
MGIVKGQKGGYIGIKVIGRFRNLRWDGLDGSEPIQWIASAYKKDIADKTKMHIN